MPMRIEDYALIGDGRSAALVSRHGSIDWLCWPAFDADTCFAALLGDDRHGVWRLTPCEQIQHASRRYIEEGLILETTLVTARGKLILTDWMDWTAVVPVLARQARCEGGTVEVECALSVRFDYGRAVPWLRRMGERTHFVAGAHTLWFDGASEASDEGNDVRFRFMMQPGERRAFSLACCGSCEPAPAVPDLGPALEHTLAFWKSWTLQCKAGGLYREAIQRSLVVLKALSDRDTGAIVAAPTSSLPEAFGGERNWDYRFCWLRDASFTLLALVNGGYRDEAANWRDWVVRAIGGDPAQLQIMYALDGSRHVDEWECDWLPGYERATPVRFGNGAVSQRQLDIYGEVLNALYQCRRAGLAPDEDAWRLERGLIEHLGHVWEKPDKGIWEIRDQPRQLTLSKVMVWVAIDRALRSAREHGHDAPEKAWQRFASQVRDEVMKRGFNAKLGSFTQTYDGEELDASLLLIPLTGFLPANDPHVMGTVRAIERQLLENGLLKRYRTANDGIDDEEGAFLACSFWLAHVRHLQGRESEARELFEHLLTLCNDVGLLSEEYDTKAKRQCGNFPQAF
ncbi:glycoside hydrolase family 15 protein, partial [Caballeronia arvi]|uniref:glycoside hydrolase family 15 protein n=1 Tax=Caballeronia arvi TaxID=1777135 RepID=UPI000ACC4024